MIINLKDIHDPRYQMLLGDYTQLKDIKLRTSVEGELGLYMAESNKVIARALRAGHQVRSMLLAEKHLPEMLEILRETGHNPNPENTEIPLLIAPEESLKEITGFHLHRGALAAMHRPKLPEANQILQSKDITRVLILEDLVDHTNVGAAFRSAAATGFDAIFVTPSCADPLYRRAVRVSMGTVFQIPWTRLPVWPTTQLWKENGFEISALGLITGAQDLEDYAAEVQSDPQQRKIALIAGTEGEGLANTTMENADRVVKIPMHHGVDSLNVAAACALACWALKNRERL